MFSSTVVGSTLFDATTHVATPSSGCGKASPYKPGQSVTATGKYAGVTWTYRVHTPCHSCILPRRRHALACILPCILPRVYAHTGCIHKVYVSLLIQVYVPKSYDAKTPLPLIIQHPGWGLSAKSEEAGAGITGYADSSQFISVTAQASLQYEIPMCPS